MKSAAGSEKKEKGRPCFFAGEYVDKTRFL
jgi:hypothetical protein